MIGKARRLVPEHVGANLIEEAIVFGVLPAKRSAMQVAGPMATWAAKNGVRQVYTLVSDYGRGADAETEFKKTFTAAGGSMRFLASAARAVSSAAMNW